MISISDTVPKEKTNEAIKQVAKIISNVEDMKDRAEAVKEKLENRGDADIDITKEFTELDQAYKRFKESRLKLSKLADSAAM